MEFLAIWSFVSNVISLILLFEYDCNRGVVFPKEIYKNTSLNKFGALSLSLLILFICPVYYILCVGYWLCHVGRK